jgi:hypothetical protein
MTTTTATTTTATPRRGPPDAAPAGGLRPPRRSWSRPQLAPACPHCHRLGSCRYSVHVAGLCVRLVADHLELAELVGGVSMRPVELAVNGEPRWLWTRSDVDAMDADDLVEMFVAFEPPAPPPTNVQPAGSVGRRVVDGGDGERPEPVALFHAEVPSSVPVATPPRSPRQPVAVAGVVAPPPPAWL